MPGFNFCTDSSVLDNHFNCLVSGVFPIIVLMHPHLACCPTRGLQGRPGTHVEAQSRLSQGCCRKQNGSLPQGKCHLLPQGGRWRVKATRLNKKLEEVTGLVVQGPLRWQSSRYVAAETTDLGVFHGVKKSTVEFHLLQTHPSLISLLAVGSLVKQNLSQLSWVWVIGLTSLEIWTLPGFWFDSGTSGHEGVCGLVSSKEVRTQIYSIA